jgi:hypothetical protein
MKTITYAGLTIGVAGILSLLVPMQVASAWNETEGCTPGYWKNNGDKNPRIGELAGINIHAAVLDIAGLNLNDYPAFDAYQTLTTEQAVQLNGGGLNAFYRHLGAAIYNIYYSVDYIEPTTTFKDIIQQAIDGDVEGAKDKLDAANNLGCPIDAFGRRE